MRGAVTVCHYSRSLKSSLRVLEIEGAGRKQDMAILHVARAELGINVHGPRGNGISPARPVHRCVLHVSPPLAPAEASPSSADTMGYAFTFFIVSWLCEVPVGAYVHYPTISTDMLERVRSRKKWHTNQSRVAESSVLSSVKLL